MIIEDPKKAAQVLGVDEKYVSFGAELLNVNLNLLQLYAVMAVLSADEEGIDLGEVPEAIRHLKEIIPEKTLLMLRDAIREGDLKKFKELLFDVANGSDQSSLSTLAKDFADDQKRFEEISGRLLDPEEK
jgi:hypothetical protein